MLTFYYHSDTPFTDEIVDKLRDMVVAHKIIIPDESTPLPQDLKTEDLPALTDGHQFWTTQDEIEQVLDEIHGELKIGRSMQSDSCHIDPDTGNSCL